MKKQIDYNVDDNLYMKYWNNATDMWLADKWTPMEHPDYTEAAYDIIIQKLVCEQLMEASREAGDELTYMKTILVRDILENIEQGFIHVLSQLNRSAYLLLVVNLNNCCSSKCTALSLKYGVPTSN